MGLRKFAIAWLVALVAIPVAAVAQPYPSRPIRVVIPLSVGSLTDIMLRKMAPDMGASLGTQLVIDNRPGAGAIVGTQAIAQAPPDGYTLGVAVTSSFSINPHLIKDLAYNPQKDFEPICRIGGASYVLVATPSLGVKSLPELLEKAKAGQLSFASAGPGTTQHLAQELFKSLTKSQFLHVPYKGSLPAVTDTVAGHTKVLFDAPGPLLAGIRAGNLVPLGISSARRISALPDVPTFVELGFAELRLDGWIGFVVPAATPPQIVERLAQACQTALASIDLQTLAKAQGFEIEFAPPAEFRKQITREFAVWGELARRAGLKPE